MGFVSKKRGFVLKGMSSAAFEGLCRDELKAKFDRPWAMKVLGKDFATAIERQAFERRRLRAFLRKEKGAITTWDGVLSNRAAGLAEDLITSKNTFTTVTTQWSSAFRAAGFPVTGTYTAIPAGAVQNRASVGAMPLSNPSGANTKYLLNFGWNLGSAAGIVLLADLLVAADNISGSTGNSQTVNTAALTRYAGSSAIGNMMTLEVTSGLGATGSINVTVGYTGVNAAGTTQPGHSSGAIALTASAISQRLVPILSGPIIAPQSGDVGVQSIETVQLSGTGIGGGTLCAQIYRPLLLMPSITTTTWTERSTGAMLAGVDVLPVGTDSQIGCLTYFVYVNGTSTGNAPTFLQTVQG